jgi:hypothetical protein
VVQSLSGTHIDRLTGVETFEQTPPEGVIQHTKVFRNVLTIIIVDVTLATPPAHVYDPSAAGRGCVPR